ncbi:SGNH/GDSL hydrolase family protein [Flagellimonas allohymeniacidonis]|uniref:SGNH/GDSL hydrolase family protein n=1 Tax=Flagellimonas allohymeniacidonis TaxID=2517819 RepID=A0A4Q8QJU2_9FLAO|nr:SGNH/GDSL hydrolase family protein [Allomuricauda hymeniacidonis]TAI49023.1 SGNH/GDSL hydrolase family protein [Allomuricauda hymeniacidonis]
MMSRAGIFQVLKSSINLVFKKYGLFGILFLFFTLKGFSGQSYSIPVSNKHNTDTLKVLFVGNSLTFYNDLPSLVRKQALSQGIQLQTEMLAFPNYALMDHWVDGKVQQLISENNYAYVVIQQGPSSQDYGREILFEYGQKFKQLCSKYGTELAYFMVWPSKRYYNTFAAVIANHRDASKVNNAILCPVGELWKNHFDATGDFSYYTNDGFHPSMLGSEMAAKVICEALFPSPKD